MDRNHLQFVEIKFHISFVTFGCLANQGAILAGQEAAHSRRRRLNLEARSVMMLCVFHSMSHFAAGHGAFYFTTPFSLQNSSADQGCISQKFMQGTILALVIVMAFRLDRT